MQFLGNYIVFDDIYEMYYNLFSELGLGINQYQYLYDQDTGNVLRFKDKYIKASITPVPIYAGKTDIVFDPAKNYQLISTLLGYYIEKIDHSENPIGFIVQYIEDDKNPDRTKVKQKLTVRTRRGDFVSSFYHSIYLCYIEVIFMISGNMIPNLSNFDTLF